MKLSKLKIDLFRPNEYCSGSQRRAACQAALACIFTVGLIPLNSPTMFGLIIKLC